MVTCDSVTVTMMTALRRTRDGACDGARQTAAAEFGCQVTIAERLFKAPDSRSCTWPLHLCMDGQLHHDPRDRAGRFADAAEAIVKDIESGAAVTTYMHRSHASQGIFTARGDVFPEWAAAEDGSGQWYGSQFGRFDPRLTFHVTDRDLRRTEPLAEATPRYYVDCAGFVRELLSAVFPPSADFDPKRDLLQRAQANNVPAGSGFAARLYPRAHIFFHEFDHCPLIDDCIAGQDEWGRVADARLLRRGDVVVQLYAQPTLHTGHIWVVVSDPDASGCYISVESSPASGVARVRRQRSQIRGPNFTIGRLVEAGPVRSIPFQGDATYRVCAGTTTLLRLGPELDSEVVACLPALTRMVAVEANDSQRRILVETSCGTVGWVTRRFLEVNDDASHPQQYCDWHSVAGQPGAHAGCRVGPHGVLLRAQADVSDRGLDLDGRNPIVLSLRYGEPLKKLAERLKVQCALDDAGGAREGWVSAWYVERC